jgi:TolB-like protein/Tfp pilus assembly protein PilF
MKPSVVVGQAKTRTWSDLDVMCLTAMHKDPLRRYDSASSLIRDIDHYLRREPLNARPDSPFYRVSKFAKRKFSAIGVMGLTIVIFAIALAWLTRSRPTLVRDKPKTIAVLPLAGPPGTDDLAYISTALPQEITRVLEYSKSLVVRPFDAQRRTDAAQAGRDLHAGTVITGEYLVHSNTVDVSLRAMDAESNRYIWQDAVSAPRGNAILLEARVLAKIRGGLGPLLNATEFADQPQPKNTEAYNLFLRSMAYLQADGVEGDLNTEQITSLLEKSIALDPTYAPAWERLAWIQRFIGWYGGEHPEMLERSQTSAERAIALDPNAVQAVRGLVVVLTGRGDVIRAYKVASDFLKRRPDHFTSHYSMAHVYRYVGLLDEAARECQAAHEIDPYDGGIRSCGITFMLRGDYKRGLEFFRMDPGWYRQVFEIETLLRKGDVAGALAARPTEPQRWAAFDVLFAFLDHQSPEQIALLTGAEKVEADSESNYLAAAHLSYAGQPQAAANMLQHAIEKHYCAYPAIDTDPLLANLRRSPFYAGIRENAMNCKSSLNAIIARMTDASTKSAQ